MRFFFFLERLGGVYSLKVVSVEYIYIFLLSFKLAALDPALMAAQFPSICYIKGVYAAQSNLRINRRRLAWSSQDCRSTRNRPVPMFIICCIHGVVQGKAQSVYAAFKNALKLSSLVKTARHSKWIWSSRHRSIKRNILSSFVCKVSMEMCPLCVLYFCTSTFSWEALLANFSFSWCPQIHFLSHNFRSNVN